VTETLAYGLPKDMLICLLLIEGGVPCCALSRSA